MDTIDDKLLAALFGLIAGIVGAIATTYVGRKTAKITRKNAIHSSLVSSVTAERATWRKDLRDAIAGIAAEVVLFAEDSSTARLATIERHRVAIRLRLNPKRTKPHALDAVILDNLLELRMALKAEKHNYAALLLEGIERAAQQLFKGEWEKSKREAMAGELEAKHSTDSEPLIGAPIHCCDPRPVFTSYSPRKPYGGGGFNARSE